MSKKGLFRILGANVYIMEAQALLTDIMPSELFTSKEPLRSPRYIIDLPTKSTSLLVVNLEYAVSPELTRITIVPLPPGNLDKKLRQLAKYYTQLEKERYYGGLV